MTGRTVQLAPAGRPESAFEKHYTPQELGEIWKLDASTIIRIIQDEVGVLKLGRAIGRNGKRAYVTLRIPASVALRVYRERTK